MNLMQWVFGLAIMIIGGTLELVALILRMGDSPMRLIMFGTGLITVGIAIGKPDTVNK